MLSSEKLSYSTVTNVFETGKKVESQMVEIKVEVVYTGRRPSGGYAVEIIGEGTYSVGTTITLTIQPKSNDDDPGIINMGEVSWYVNGEFYGGGPGPSTITLLINSTDISIRCEYS